ncbi:methylenetetrahydrofolate reductase [Ruegeria sp. Ofav3-42]|uniref:methylenetetrahydrofolate reductase n=1 Tax=Ruegeria sp. Ofav3-42 TaxID=2917759 RepID=UPI001EF45F69|nr:methylenetetrahydrofolate reductase [Ruegeria sp. Ofav3-42]MCG7522537.1 methylenetetrahydrofolate reductase [Ruegeria sp. Ofav3-42]
MSTGDIPSMTAYPELPDGLVSGSRLERALKAGKFAITAELNPPDSSDPEDVYRAAQPLSEVTDAINATDASGANCHMSSIGISAFLSQAGYEAVYQISCRDRNRIAIQGDVLGAAALGVRNVLCLTGDDVGAGDQPGAKPVFDLDSLSLLRTLRTMRDDGVFLSGRKISKPPRLFLGAAENPCVDPLVWRPDRLAKKIAAGAEFIQTNYIFDLPRFRAFMDRVRDLGLDEKVFLLAGVGPLASARAARWMRSNVPGIHIPDQVINRIENAKDQALEGQIICTELIEEIRDIPGLSGVHVMAYRREHLVSQIIKDSGLLERRSRGAQLAAPNVS